MLSYKCEVPRMIYSEIVIDCKYGGLNPMQFGYETCKPSHSYGPAVRTHWLLHYVVAGFGEFTREGITYKIGPGQMFVIPPYIETYYEADNKRPWQYTWIGFTSDEQLPDVFYQPVISCPDIGELFDEMKLCNKLENGRSAFLSGCLWKLVATLQENKKPSSDYIDKALNCMHSEYSHGITIKAIADRLGLDRSHFYTIFLERVGTSPSEYLINLRLAKAAELMRDYNERPSVAATSVGYEDLYHFSKIFKKHFGMCPREYRKNMQK